MGVEEGLGCTSLPTTSVLPPTGRSNSVGKRQNKHNLNSRKGRGGKAKQRPYIREMMHSALNL